MLTRGGAEFAVVFRARAIHHVNDGLALSAGIDFGGGSRSITSLSGSDAAFAQKAFSTFILWVGTKQRWIFNMLYARPAKEIIYCRD